jgi:hypothetical protein
VGIGDLSKVRFQLHRLLEEKNTPFAIRAQLLNQTALQSFGVPDGIGNAWASFRCLDLTVPWYMSVWELWSSQLVAVDFRPMHVVVTQHRDFQPEKVWHGRQQHKSRRRRPNAAPLGPAPVPLDIPSSDSDALEAALGEVLEEAGLLRGEDDDADQGPHSLHSQSLSYTHRHTNRGSKSSK